MLTKAGCLVRQERLRQALAEGGIDAAVISDPLEIYYFTGLLLPKTPHVLRALLWIDAATSWLIAPMDMGEAAVDEHLTYEWSHNYTTSADWTRSISALAAARLGGSAGVRRLGWQAELLPHLLGLTIETAIHPDEWIAIDDLISGMEARKDPDEIALIRQSIAVNIAGYKAAKAAIQPGATELDVLLAGQVAAARAAGESLWHGGDYRCAAFGGTARPRPIEAGELYIVDAWTWYHGYWSDMSRTYIVGDTITPLQQSIFDHMKAIHAEVPGLLKPGVDGTEVWRAIDAMIRQHPAFAEKGLIHHAGHTIGLHAHELPDLNPDRGGILEVGNVVNVEPGGYLDEARYGVRLENMYLITETGVENLSGDFPMELR